MLQRLKSLEKGELSHLIRRKLWTKKARFISSFNLTYPFGRVERFLKKRIENCSLTVHFKSKERPFFFDYEDLESIKHIYKEEFWGIEKTILKKADGYCKKEYHLLNTGFSFEDEINWHYDPISKRDWPNVFYKDIPYTGPERIGDIKLPWELNRHQYIVVLGQAYVLSEDEKYAEQIVSIINSWINENPPYLGINWISALEVGIRLISWIWAFHLIKHSGKVTEEFMRKFLASIAIQTKYVEMNLTLGRYGNNHLIGEAASLAVVGLYFKEFRNADRWTEKALLILEREVLKQVYPDGGGIEQAISYLHFIVEFFLLASMLALKNNIKVLSAAMARIEKAFEFIALTGTPGGLSPRFGDSDDARAIFFGENNNWDFRGLLAIGAVLFNRGDFKWVAGKPSEELLWFMGSKGIADFNRLERREPKSKTCVFEQTGYMVMRDNWDKKSSYLIFDHGDLGYGSGAHGHADALSFQLYLNGNPILIDPGTFAYNQSQELRKYFRGTSAHNTVLIDGKDQSESTGRMSWTKQAVVKVNNIITRDVFDFIDAEHNGYNRLDQPVYHRRKLLCVKDKYYFIHDSLIGEAYHDFELNYHFSPSLSVEIFNQNRVLVKRDKEIIGTLIICCQHDVKMKIYCGSHSIIKGWYSDRYGHKTPSPTLTVSGHIEFPFVITTLIFPLTLKNIENYYDIQMIDKSSFLIRGRDSMDFVVMQDPWTCKLEDLEFDGKLLYVSSDSERQMKHFLVDGAKKLYLTGNTFLRFK